MKVSGGAWGKTGGFANRVSESTNQQYYGHQGLAIEASRKCILPTSKAPHLLLILPIY